MSDRYIRVVLTIIAACLVYLCLVVSRVGTPLSAQQVQPPQGAPRPGMATGPAEVVVVGFRLSQDEALPVTVRNVVTTQQSADNAARVVLAGWEDRRTNTLVRLAPDSGLPTDASASLRAAKVVLVGTETMSGATWEKRVPVEPPREAAKR